MVQDWENQNKLGKCWWSRAQARIWGWNNYLSASGQFSLSNKRPLWESSECYWVVILSKYLHFICHPWFTMALSIATYIMWSMYKKKFKIRCNHDIKKTLIIWLEISSVHAFPPFNIKKQSKTKNPNKQNWEKLDAWHLETSGRGEAVALDTGIWMVTLGM